MDSTRIGSKFRHLLSAKMIVSSPATSSRRLSIWAGPQIYRLCMAALAQGNQAPRGYILMPGCGIPPNVPTQNLLMLKKAASDFMDGHKNLG